MQAASLDILEKAQVPSIQARAMLEVIDLEIAAKNSQLATRLDISQMKHDLELKIESIRSELVRWVFMCVMGQTAMLIGAGYFLAEHWHR